MINVSNEENKESPCLTSAINELKNEESNDLSQHVHCVFSVTTIVMVVAIPLFAFLLFAPVPVVLGAFFVFMIVLMLVL